MRKPSVPKQHLSDMENPLYSINQCALYKVQSKARLAGLLHIGIPAMLGLAKSRKYRQFELDEHVCEYTGKKTGARSVQTPAEALRPIHDRIFDLLKRVVPPPYAHAAVKGRSYRTNAEVHKNSSEVATYDIKGFYRATSDEAVFRFFRDQLLCASDIAKVLTHIVCFPGGDDKGCLPTGSPLSPLVSIYANKPMFDALDRLATKNCLTFTCYVDDLTFSGAAIPSGFSNMVDAAVKRAGHVLAHQKTRLFLDGTAKHVTGVVLFKGEVKAPHSRHQKARKLEKAITKVIDPKIKIKLMQMRAGLLGETAYLDKRYKPRALASYKELADMRRFSVPAST